MFMRLKKFSEVSGIPVTLLRIFCKDGTIPCLQRGNLYLVDSEESLKILKEQAKERVHKPIQGNYLDMLEGLRQ